MLDANQLQKADVADEGRELLMESPQVVPAEHFGMIEDASPPPLSFAESILDADALSKLEIPKRECLVGSWWKAGASGFIFGERGKGKTWMSLYLARRLAEGRDCGPWKIPKARRVLYVDGEMALDSLQERDCALSQSSGSLLHFLSHQQHFNKLGLGLNFTDPAAQKALLDECDRLNIEVLFLDNLSCLFSGVGENKADDWEAILPWLLTLRRKGIATCIVHHPNRGGADMRGTSRREDAAFWIMRAATPRSESEVKSGHKASFVGRFTKNREGSAEDEGPWQWTFETPAVGEPTTIRWSLIDNLETFVHLVEDGLDTCSMLAEEMHLSKGAVSKLAKRAASQKFIAIEGEGNQRKYIPIARPHTS